MCVCVCVCVCVCACVQALFVELERERSSNKGQGAHGKLASATDGSGECRECAGLRVELACALDRLDEAEV